MLRRVRLSTVLSLFVVAGVFLGLQYLATFQSSVRTTQEYTVSMHEEIRAAFERQQESIEETRQAEAARMQEIVDDVAERVQQLIREQSVQENTVLQQLETVVQQLRATQRGAQEVLEGGQAAAARVALAEDMSQILLRVDQIVFALDAREEERAHEEEERRNFRELAATLGLDDRETETPHVAGEVAHVPTQEELEQRVAGEMQRRCEVEDSAYHAAADLEATLLTGGWSETDVLPSYSYADLYPTTAEEIFLEDERKSLIFRLGFPSTSSSNMRNVIVEASEISVSGDLSVRLPQCASAVLVGCGEVSGEQSREAALDHFRLYAGKIATTPTDAGQHLALGRKEETVWTLVEKEEFNEDFLLRATMLREPTQYANRVFQDQRTFDGTVEEMKKKMGIQGVSKTYFFFDQLFEEMTQCSVEYVTFEQWVDLSYWRWNYFVRGMADDYVSTIWLRYSSRVTTTRDSAWAENELGAESALLQSAVKKLHEFAFFGIYDKLELSMELFAFTFCIDFDALGFTFKRPTKAMKNPELHLARGAALVGDEGYRAMRDKHRLDYLYFEYAEDLFDRRVAAMHAAKERGYRCMLPDTSCGLLC